MNTFLDSLRDKLAAMEREVQTLPGQLDSVVIRMDRGKLRSLVLSVSQDFNKLVDELFAAQRSSMLTIPLVFIPNYPFLREITNEDLSRWREAYKLEVRVVIGKGRVEVIAPSELAKEYKTTVSKVILAAQQQGCMVLGWDQYQKLLDEIGSLIGEDNESLPETIVGIPVTTTDLPQEVKVLPKNSSLLPSAPLDKHPSLCP